MNKFMRTTAKLFLIGSMSGLVAILVSILINFIAEFRV